MGLKAVKFFGDSPEKLSIFGTAKASAERPVLSKNDLLDFIIFSFFEGYMKDFF